MKEYPMTMNKKHFTAISNDLIKGKQSMTLQEARIIRLLVTQVVKEDKDLKTYTCRIADLANFLGVPSENLYRDVRSICKQLMTRTIYVGTEDPKMPWKIFQWVQRAEYDGNGNLTLMLSNQIAPYVVNLEQWFTQYKIGNILAMDSYYAIRLYELLRCDDGIRRHTEPFHEYTVQELRSYFNCEKKYKTTAEFNRKVTIVAINEINSKTDIKVDVEYRKTGRAITSIRFYIMPNSELVGQMTL